MKALPPMRCLTTQEDALDWLAQIN
jgi:hypothetical protein